MNKSVFELVLVIPKAKIQPGYVSSKVLTLNPNRTYTYYTNILIEHTFIIQTPLINHRKVYYKRTMHVEQYVYKNFNFKP